MTNQFIESGRLKRRDSQSSRREDDPESSCFEMKFLRSGSIPDLLKLQSIIASNLPCPQIFMLHDDQYLQEVVCHERSIIGAIADGELIAFSVVRIPGICTDNLGRDIDLPAGELARVAHLQAAAVHPAYRGNGLQRKLTIAHLRIIEEMGYEHACCTVSPWNPVSLRNYLSCGLVIEGLRPKMNGWWRFILHRKISCRNSVDLEGEADANEKKSEVSREEHRALISDIDGQSSLLKIGFKGFKVESHPGGEQVLYARF